MRFCLISSDSNIASKNIREVLLKNFDFKLVNGKFTLEQDGNIIFVEIIRDSLLEFNNPESFIDADVFVFLCSHTSSKGVPALTVHAPGNFGSAVLGGFDKSVSVVSANLMKLALRSLKKNRDVMKLDYDVCYEATHHGPLVNKPCMFIELGSDEKGWSDEVGALCVAKSLMEAIGDLRSSGNFVSVFCLGGNHYCQNFTKIGLYSVYAPGHICSKRDLEFLDEDFVVRCLESCVPKCEVVVLDWKGLSGVFKDRLLPVFERLGVKVLRVSEIEKNS